METFFLDQLKGNFKDSSLTIGNFDGLHLGHQRIIEVVRDEAKKIRGKSLLLTFSPLVGQFFKKKRWFPLLSWKEKKEILEDLGIDLCILVKFNSSFANLSPFSFINEVIKKRLGVKVVVVGSDFRFGKGRRGDIDLLYQEGRKVGLEVRIVEPVKVKGEVVSSSLIRKYILQASLDKVSLLLGRPYSLRGSVTKGDKIGREIQFPTANLNLENIPLPSGVYVVKSLVKEKSYFGLANIGFCPTFHKDRKRVEVYLFNFRGDLYGSEIELFFLKRLRPEIKFRDKEELRRQVEKDTQEAKKFIESQFNFNKGGINGKYCFGFGK